MPASKYILWNDNDSSNIEGLVIGQVRRSLIGAPRGPKLTIPGRAGFIHFPQPPGPRKIIATGFIEAPTFQQRRDRFEELADWLDVQLEARLVISDTPDVYYMGVIEESGDANEWRSTGTFELVWQVQPYAYALTTTEEAWVASIADDHLWDPDITTLVYPVIEIQPTNGTLTGFELTVNDQVFSYAGMIADDAIITINSIAAVALTGASGDTELTGAYDPNALSMSGVDGIFPELVPDTTNSIEFDAAGGTATNINITTTYRRAYRK